MHAFPDVDRHRQYEISEQELACRDDAQKLETLSAKATEIQVRQSSLKNQVDTARARVKSKLGFWILVLLGRPLRFICTMHQADHDLLSAALIFGFKRCAIKFWKSLAAPASTTFSRQLRATITLQLSKLRVFHEKHKSGARYRCVGPYYIFILCTLATSSTMCRKSELAPALLRVFQKFVREAKADKSCPCCKRAFETESALSDAIKEVRTRDRCWSVV